MIQIPCHCERGHMQFSGLLQRVHLLVFAFSQKVKVAAQITTAVEKKIVKTARRWTADGYAKSMPSTPLSEVNSNSILQQKSLVLL